MFYKKKKIKKVRLVLGSGGTRGVAHIGVIERLEENGYEIVEVIGCSMGAVIGGMYAAGKMEDYKKWMISLTKKKVFDLLDFTLTSQGFVKGEKLFAQHLEVAGKIDIESLRIPFTDVATDMIHSKEVHFTSGDLYKALRASVSIPSVFVPVVYEDKVLVDGGVLNPLPINLAKKKRDEIIVAVDLNARKNDKLQTYIKSKVKEEKQNSDFKNWVDSILPKSFKDVGKIKEAQEIEIQSFSLLEMMNNTFSLTQDRLTDLMLELHKPDLLIEIPRDVCETFEFYRSKEIIEIGRKAFDLANVEKNII